MLYEYIMWGSGVLGVVCILWAIKLVRELRRIDKVIAQGEENIARLKRAIERYSVKEEE